MRAWRPGWGLRIHSKNPPPEPTPPGLLRIDETPLGETHQEGRAGRAQGEAQGASSRFEFRSRMGTAVLLKSPGTYTRVGSESRPIAVYADLQQVLTPNKPPSILVSMFGNVFSSDFPQVALQSLIGCMVMRFVLRGKHTVKYEVL